MSSCNAGFFVCASAVLHKAMRSALSGFLICGLAFVLSGPASGATPEASGFTAPSAMLPAQSSNNACYVRSYDATYMSAHPRQRINAMKFLLGVQAYDPKPANAEQPGDLFYYTFSMSVALRGDKWLLRSSGDCVASDTISCVVDCNCDGGSVVLDKLSLADSLIVRLNDDGIRMFHDFDEEKGVLVKSDADNKLFCLHKTANEACRALDESEK